MRSVVVAYRYGRDGAEEGHSLIILRMLRIIDSCKIRIVSSMCNVTKKNHIIHTKKLSDRSIAIIDEISIISLFMVMYCCVVSPFPTDHKSPHFPRNAAVIH